MASVHWPVCQLSHIARGTQSQRPQASKGLKRLQAEPRGVRERRVGVFTQVGLVTHQLLDDSFDQC